MSKGVDEMEISVCSWKGMQWGRGWMVRVCWYRGESVRWN